MWEASYTTSLAAPSVRRRRAAARKLRATLQRERRRRKDSQRQHDQALLHAATLLRWRLPPSQVGDVAALRRDAEDFGLQLQGGGTSEEYPFYLVGRRFAIETVRAHLLEHYLFETPRILENF